MANHAQVVEFLSSYGAAWAANDVGRLASHWLPDAFAYYKAEEIDHYLRTWDEVTEYFDHNARVNERVRLQFGDYSLIELTPELHMAAVPMRWDIRFSRNARTMDGAPFAHRGKAMGGDNHVLILLRDTASGPKLVGWSETPDAPVSYVARLYVKNAAPDL